MRESEIESYLRNEVKKKNGIAINLSRQDMQGARPNCSSSG